MLRTLDAEVKLGLDRLSDVQGGGFDASIKSQYQSVASAYSDHAKSLRDQLSYLFYAADQDYKQAKTEQERTSIRASRDRLVELASTQVGRAQAINLLAIAFEKNPTDTSFKELRNAVDGLMRQPTTEMWKVREEYDAVMRTGMLLGGRLDMLHAEWYYYAELTLEGLGAQPLVLPGPLQLDAVQRIASEIVSLTHEDMRVWAQLRAGTESRIDQYFGSSVAALAKVNPLPRELDAYSELTRTLASLKPEFLSRDQEARREWTASAAEALERAKQAYGSGLESMLGTRRDLVLKAMDKAMIDKAPDRQGQLP